MTNDLYESFVEDGVILRNDHFVLSSFRHSRDYFVAKRVTKNPEKYGEPVGLELVSGIIGQIDTVVGVATEGNPLAEWSGITLRLVYTETSHQSGKVVTVCTSKTNGLFYLNGPQQLDAVYWIKDKKVLVVDDVCTSGESLAAVIRLIRSYGGNVIGASVLCSHGNVTPDRFKIPEFHSVIEMPMETWPVGQCPMCIADYPPINIEHGHGKEYLEALEQQKTLGASR